MTTKVPARNVSRKVRYTRRGSSPEIVKLKASGASKARVYASEELMIDASLVSEVKYRGGAKVSTVKSSSFSNVKED